MSSVTFIKILTYLFYGHEICSFSLGRGGEVLGQQLAEQLEEAYSSNSCFDCMSLSVIPGEQCWVLYVDALVSSNYIIYMYVMCILWLDVLIFISYLRLEGVCWTACRLV